MIILPAIDLYGGRVVRLRKGDFSEKTDYGGDPLEIAREFTEKGCRYLHIVDLEGAECGSPKHLSMLEKLRGLDIEIEFGGGLRSREAIGDALRAGADSVMVGSLLFKGEHLVDELFEEFGASITPSLDVRDGKVVISGWKERTEETLAGCIEKLSLTGYKTFLVTSVEKDGMLEGPDLNLYGDLLRQVGNNADIIAAGGVTSIEDIKRLRSTGTYGAVVGRAIYEKGFDLSEALAIARGDK
jgi:phosphoribosylformimino-5-aminoimidazole carboxamide ribotide isomerase